MRVEFQKDTEATTRLHKAMLASSYSEVRAIYDGLGPMDFIGGFAREMQVVSRVSGAPQETVHLPIASCNIFYRDIDHKLARPWHQYHPNYMNDCVWRGQAFDE